jgi:hypothetical protein
MENTLQIFKKHAGIIVAAFLPVILYSCTKITPNPNPSPQADLAVIAVSPDAPAFDFYFSTTQVNTAPLVYGSGISYFQANAGEVALGFYNQGTTTKVVTDTVNIKANTSNTLFLTNLIAKHDFLFLTDTLNQPAVGTATIRFVDVSPDAPAVDFAIRGGSVLATHRLYKTFTSFMTIQPKLSDTLEIRQSGTSTVLASIPTVTITSNEIYTVWLYGLANTTVAAQKLKAGAMVNFNFNY